MAYFTLYLICKRKSFDCLNLQVACFAEVSISFDDAIKLPVFVNCILWLSVFTFWLLSKQNILPSLVGEQKNNKNEC